MSVPERPSLSGASSNGISRVLSRRRKLSDPRPLTPEPVAAPHIDVEEETPDVEVSKDRKFRVAFWITIILLQASVVSSCLSVVYLVQGIRRFGPQAFHLIWVVLSGALCIVLAGTAWVLMRKRREHRCAAEEMAIARLSADVEVLVEQNIELQISNRRSRDHGSMSERRASPLGEEDFASYHRFQEKGMDRQVKAWLGQMEPFDGRFEDIRRDSWFAETNNEPVGEPGVRIFTAAPLQTARTA